MTYFIIFILAFCSIVYELLLAQALAAFLENTALRYCVTIGLYMFSMGLGSLAAEGKHAKHPVLTLLRIEILLTVIGGFSLLNLHMLNMLDLPRAVFSLSAHTLIICIGVLTGFEIPLLIGIVQTKKKSPENLVLGINYFGAFVGTLCFAFLFYPKMGLMPTAFLIGSLNALAGASLITLRPMVDKDTQKHFSFSLSLQTVILIIIGSCLIFAVPINEFFMRIYMSGT